MVKRSSGRWSSRFSFPGSVMFTRRTATVMISAPDASTARRVSSNDRYFPVPMINRERYSRPASRKGSSIVMCRSAASDEVNDLDGVALAQRRRRVRGTRYDRPVELDRDAPPTEPERGHEVGHRRTVGQHMRLVVHRHLH